MSRALALELSCTLLCNQQSLFITTYWRQNGPYFNCPSPIGCDMNTLCVIDSFHQEFIQWVSEIQKQSPLVLIHLIAVIIYANFSLIFFLQAYLQFSKLEPRMIVTVQDKTDDYFNILWVRSLCQAETIELQPNSENSSTAVRIKVFTSLVM